MSYFGDVYTGDHLSTISKVHINKQILFTHKLIVSYSVQASKKISVFRISRIPSFYLKAKCKAMVSIDMKDKRLHIFENFCCLNRTSGCHRIIFAFTKRVLSFRAEMSFDGFEYYIPISRGIEFYLRKLIFLTGHILHLEENVKCKDSLSTYRLL